MSRGWNQHKKLIQKMPECRRCGAKKGEPCRSIQGNQANPHAARIEDLITKQNEKTSVRCKGSGILVTGSKFNCKHCGRVFHRPPSKEKAHFWKLSNHSAEVKKT